MERDEQDEREKRGKRTRRRPRRGERGSAAIEMLVMMPVIVLAMAVSYWATDLYEGQIGAMKAARGPVFTQATHACGHAGATSYDVPRDDAPRLDDDTIATHDTAGDVGRVDGADLDVIGKKLPSAPGASVVDRAVVDRDGQIVRTIVANPLIGNLTTNLRGSASMTCNEAVHDGEPDAMKKHAFDNFDSRALP